MHTYLESVVRKPQKNLRDLLCMCVVRIGNTRSILYLLVYSTVLLAISTMMYNSYLRLIH